jgi:hypothetical protein
LAPARGLPDAELLLADCRPIAARFHRAQETPGNRIGYGQHRWSSHPRSSLTCSASDAGFWQPVFFQGWKPLFNAKSSATPSLVKR